MKSLVDCLLLFVLVPSSPALADPPPADEAPLPRLDPSGNWKSDIGELSVLLNGTDLYFTYTAVFGSNAHICEGSGKARSIGANRYRWNDESGSVELSVFNDQLKLLLTDGIASFCGAFWSTDTFSNDSFSAPQSCRVKIERSFFSGINPMADAQAHPYVIENDIVEAVPAHLLLEYDAMLVRYSGNASVTIGIMKRDDLVCEESRDASSQPDQAQ